MFIPVKIQLCNVLPIDTNLTSRFPVVTFMMGDHLIYQVPQNNFGHALHWRHRIEASAQIAPQIKFSFPGCLSPFYFSSQLPFYIVFPYLRLLFLLFFLVFFWLAGFLSFPVFWDAAVRYCIVSDVSTWSR